MSQTDGEDIVFQIGDKVVRDLSVLPQTLFRPAVNADTPSTSGTSGAAKAALTTADDVGDIDKERLEALVVSRPDDPPPAALDAAKTMPTTASAEVNNLRHQHQESDFAARLAALEKAVSELVSKKPAPANDPVLDIFSSPSKPSVPVVFTTADAVHRAYFHHVAIRGRSLMLFYDDRYAEGHRFMPLPTPEGQSIRVTVRDGSGPMSREVTYEAAVLSLNNTLGPIDIVQLFLIRLCDDSRAGDEEPSIASGSGRRASQYPAS